MSMFTRQSKRLMHKKVTHSLSVSQSVCLFLSIYWSKNPSRSTEDHLLIQVYQVSGDSVTFSALCESLITVGQKRIVQTYLRRVKTGTQVTASTLPARSAHSGSVFVCLSVAAWHEVVASFYVYSTKENCRLWTTSPPLIRYFITWRMSPQLITWLTFTHLITSCTCTITADCHVQVKDRSQAVLISEIQCFIAPGTQILSDGMASYQRLPEFGYQHG